MKKIVVLSGKGGTGKTTISSSFASLMGESSKLNIADCDVEAPNLHLMFKHELIEQKEYYGVKCAVLNQDLCTNCKLCYEKCRFDAILLDKDENVVIDDLSCEGCGLCEYICPVDAITMEDELTGHINSAKIENGYLSYANLKIGAEGAGKVVTEVRKMAEGQKLQSNENENEKSATNEKNEEFPYLLIDGSPGIGCVVIASLTGCDYALVITEPTQSGLSDLQRVVELIKFFNMPCYVIINKYDLNTDKTLEIENYVKKIKESDKDFNFDLEVVGKIPFDKSVSDAIQNEIPVVKYENSEAGRSIIQIWNELSLKLNN
ncbi:ATP-binding protein [Methanococcus voltae]|uniref:Cobyrinic acid ac-diamide synthase n=1 Tax=Methanococcus voltae (strain ATCC BAA-1334 / A3) TaxID=456320 RepID=D7DT90_METV3|nr:ATP-binding protein [Methanococcus voltae]MCS3901200.1 MinD superfamily P-loop ATPase [Methanococcus voltae]